VCDKRRPATSRVTKLPSSPCAAGRFRRTMGLPNSLRRSRPVGFARARSREPRHLSNRRGALFAAAQRRRVPDDSRRATSRCDRRSRARAARGRVGGRGRLPHARPRRLLPLGIHARLLERVHVHHAERRVLGADVESAPGPTPGPLPDHQGLQPALPRLSEPPRAALALWPDLVLERRRDRRVPKPSWLGRCSSASVCAGTYVRAIGFPWTKRRSARTLITR
jgi:hypothetical protein